LHLHEFLRGRSTASGLSYRVVRATPQRWASALLAAATLGGIALLAGCQSYNPNLGAAPTQSSGLSYATPAAAVAGGPAFTLTVVGAGFVSGSTVQWNGSNRPTNFIDSGDLGAAISAADIASAGTFQIRVLSPGPNVGNNFSNILAFQVCSGACPSAAAASAAAKARADALSGDSFSPAISANRRYVAFAAVSADPATDASTGVRKIFLRDTCIGAPAGCAPTTILVSAGWKDAAPNGDSRSPTISADARFVAFSSEGGNLVAADTNGLSDVFLRDTCIGAPDGCTPATTRLSVGPDGGDANGASESPSISPDGRFVAFDSTAGNLVLDGSSAPTGAFLRDTCFNAAVACTPATTRLAISPAPPR
jgi:WD40-like Beta Propeller Repeat